MVKSRKRTIEIRNWTLEEEIRGHLSLWYHDKQFKTLNPMLRDTISYLIDLFKTDDQVKETQGWLPVEMQNKNKDIIQERKLFITMYKHKYLEITDLNCEENISSVTMTILTKTIEKIKHNHGTVAEYLNWVFDEFFCSDSGRKFLPPCVKTVLSDFLVKKYLFEMGDILRIRKNDIIECQRKTNVLKLGLELFKEYQDEKLAIFINKYSNGDYGTEKTLQFLTNIAEKNNNQSILDKLANV